jgi:hypothetical protein
LDIIRKCCWWKYEIDISGNAAGGKMKLDIGNAGGNMKLDIIGGNAAGGNMKLD